ncbi:MAG: ribbon-helix-helix protein, CopG family [Acidobacteria bacterium]|nr:ribbon-helix-helix protein, CopG family [Acidobacteriota bacterium]
MSLKVPDVLEQRLARLAESRGASRSGLIREALERFLDEGSAHPDSCLARAADLIGSVEGPADLSHNKKRLEGFGK